MKTACIDKNSRIEKIEWAFLEGERPRSAGGNARLGAHGKNIRLPLARITAGGETGFGWSMVSREQAAAMIGKRMDEIFTEKGTVYAEYNPVEFPLLDWMGTICGKPVYSLISEEHTGPISVACYDTSLYFDDLHLRTEEAAVEWMQGEAREGWEQGHRAFKMKVGRGARHMPLMEGIRRDIAMIRGVREAVGPEAKLMIDANNGYNLNIAKDVLLATAGQNLYWLEEAFHEDPELYRELKSWIKGQDLQVLIADGEGVAAPPLLDWAKKGWIDVIQYDLRHYGFHRWMELGKVLDEYHIKSAPHNYGGPYGNYATCHLATVIRNLAMVEWDEAKVPGLDASAYTIADGYVSVPPEPGFGLKLDDAWFSRAVEHSGWILTE